MLRILVTGSRHWTDRDRIAATLDQTWRDHGSPRSVVLAHGDCPYGGADILAADVAEERGWQVDPHPAEWKRYGRRAGPIRNQAMVDLGADVVIAFPEEGSRGTWDCVRKARTAGIPVHVVEGTQ